MRAHITFLNIVFRCILSKGLRPAAKAHGCGEGNASRQGKRKISGSGETKSHQSRKGLSLGWSSKAGIPDDAISMSHKLYFDFSSEAYSDGVRPSHGRVDAEGERENSSHASPVCLHVNYMYIYIYIYIYILLTVAIWAQTHPVLLTLAIGRLRAKQHWLQNI